MLQNRIQALREARENGEDGFTLVELLIVIVVLGILAGIVVFGVGTFRADSAAAACKATVKTVNVASDAYVAKNNGIPSVAQLVSGKYIETDPTTATPAIALAVDAAGEWTSTTCP